MRSPGTYSQVPAPETPEESRQPLTHPGAGEGRALGFLPSLDSPSQEVIPEKANVASAAPPPPESPASTKPSSSPCELASTGVPRSRHRRHGRHKGPEKMRHGDCGTERLARGGRWRLWTERWTGGAGRRRGGPRPRSHTLADAAPGPHPTKSRVAVPPALHPESRALRAGRTFNSASPRPQAVQATPLSRSPGGAILGLPAEKPRLWRLQPSAWAKEPDRGAGQLGTLHSTPSCHWGPGLLGYSAPSTGRNPRHRVSKAPHVYGNFYGSGHRRNSTSVREGRKKNPGVGGGARKSRVKGVHLLRVGLGSFCGSHGPDAMKLSLTL